MGTREIRNWSRLSWRKARMGRTQIRNQVWRSGVGSLTSTETTTGLMRCYRSRSVLTYDSMWTTYSCSRTIVHLHWPLLTEARSKVRWRRMSSRRIRLCNNRFKQTRKHSKIAETRSMWANWSSPSQMRHQANLSQSRKPGGLQASNQRTKESNHCWLKNRKPHWDQCPTWTCYLRSLRPHMEMWKSNHQAHWRRSV